MRDFDDEGDAARATEPPARDGQATPTPSRLPPRRGTAPYRKLGKYRILRKVGSGAMGTIYEGFDEIFQRRVAIKVLAPQYAKDENLRDRFLSEAQAMAQVHSPHVVMVLYSGEVDGIYFFSMEFVDGTDLRQLVKKQGPLFVDEAIGYMIQAATGLKAAHEGGVIHRDIKPANIMIGRENRVKITDFGLAKGDYRDKELTRKGDVMGTPTYMSPEQARGMQMDFRTDIYSLGASLYFLLTGGPPFKVRSIIELLQKHIQSPVPLVPDLPDEYNDVLQRMMAKSPDERYPSYDELIAALEALR